MARGSLETFQNKTYQRQSDAKGSDKSVQPLPPRSNPPLPPPSLSYLLLCLRKRGEEQEGEKGSNLQQ